MAKEIVVRCDVDSSEKTQNSHWYTLEMDPQSFSLTRALSGADIDGQYYICGERCANAALAAFFHGDKNLATAKRFLVGLSSPRLEE